MTNVKEVGFIVNLYQPFSVKESDFKHFVDNYIAPFIRLVKSSKVHPVSVNLPISTLELLEEHSYSSVISDFQDLYNTEKIEMLGSISYQPLVSNISKGLLSKQVILNEYALGYYLGSRQGFEGEPSIMVKNLKTLFVSDFNVSKDLLSVLKELGYTHLAVLNEGAKEVNVFNFESAEESLSHCYYTSLSSGIDEFEDIVDTIGSSHQQLVKTCDLFGVFNCSEKHYEIQSRNSDAFKKVEKLLETAYMTIDDKLSTSEFETLGIWKKSELSKVSDVNIYNNLCSYIALSKFLCIDKYQEEGSSIDIYVDLAQEFIKYYGDPDLTLKVVSLLKEIKLHP